MVEVDRLLRVRVSASATRAFLGAMALGEHSVAAGSRPLLQGAVEIEAGFADLRLGLVDATVMALAEERDLPILTFDFEHFHPTYPRHGYWQLIVDEGRYRDATGA